MAPPENGTAVYPHGHFPRRSRRQLRRRWAVVRSLGVGLLALPAGILATASPLAQAYRTPLSALVAPTPAPAARVKQQLQVKHTTVSEHAAHAVASALSIWTAEHPQARLTRPPSNREG